MSTTRQVALLRGINLGPHRRIAMAPLRELLTGLGYGDVRTHLNSGNAVFSNDSTTPEQAAVDIERGIAEHFGTAVPVLVRTADDLAAVVDANPLAEVAVDPSRYLVAFLSGPADRTLLADLDPAAYAPEAFHLGNREIYLWYPDGVMAAKLTHTFWEKRLKLRATARNWNTVTRLRVLATG